MVHTFPSHSYLKLRGVECGRFRGDSSVTTQVDWARSCHSCTKNNFLNILMMASVTLSSTSAVFSEIQLLLFLAWLHLKIFHNFSFFTLWGFCAGIPRVFVEKSKFALLRVRLL